MTLPPDAVEAAAKAICDCDAANGFPRWEMLTDYEIEAYTIKGNAAILAFLEAMKAGGHAKEGLAYVLPYDDVQTKNWVATTGHEPTPGDFPVIIMRLEK